MIGNVLGAFGGVWERLGLFWSVLKRLNVFRTFWECIGAFGSSGRLGKLGSIIPYGMYLRT